MKAHPAMQRSPSRAGPPLDGRGPAQNRHGTGEKHALRTPCGHARTRPCACRRHVARTQLNHARHLSPPINLSPPATRQLSCPYLAGTSRAQARAGSLGSAGGVPDTVGGISSSHRISAGRAVNPVQPGFPMGCVQGWWTQGPTSGPTLVARGGAASAASYYFRNCEAVPPRSLFCLSPARSSAAGMEVLQRRVRGGGLRHACRPSRLSRSARAVQF